MLDDDYCMNAGLISSFLSYKESSSYLHQFMFNYHFIYYPCYIFIYCWYTPYYI